MTLGFVFIFLNLISLINCQECSMVTETTPYWTYKIVSNPVIYETAEDTCIQMGGHLVSITNAFEAQIVGEFAQNVFQKEAIEEFWIGATCVNGSWAWTDSSEWSFSNWYPGKEPRLSERAAVQMNQGYWTTAYPTDLKPFVCGIRTTTPQPCPTCPVCKQQIRKCESGWAYSSGTKSCYKFLRNKTFVDGEMACQALDSHLVSIHSKDENIFVTDLVETGLWLTSYNQDLYLGMMRSGNDWFWTDGTKPDYFNWAAGEPSNIGHKEDCVELYADVVKNTSFPEPKKYEWNSIECNLNMRMVVCKKKVKVY